MDTLVLTGSGLTLEQVKQVARQGRKISIAPETYAAMEETRRIVFELAEQDHPIYGFTVGVGWNKDVKVFKEYFQQYNHNLIFSHCIGVEPWASEEEVRAVMLARLNTLLANRTGVGPQIARMYADMLNAGIHPRIPERGSVGEADIGCTSHIGLAMIGEGEVYYRGAVMNSAEALRKEGLEPLVLGPKDGLAIVTNNALAAGQGAVALYELKEFMLMADLVYAMSLEGFNGNLSPLMPETHEARPYLHQMETAARISRFLEGSYLHQPIPVRALQDPLSFRDIAQVHGAVWHAIAYTEELLDVQLNTSDDNPCFIPEKRNFFSCANYEPLVWVLGFEMLDIALSHVSKTSGLRTIKLVTPEFTGLNRFLSPDKSVLCYGTIQKTFTSLDAENRHLANPASVDGLSIAGDIEDRHTNAPFIVQKTRKMIDNLRFIFAIELLHAAQALDYRSGSNLPLGKVTRQAFDLVRETIPFYDKDRNLTVDIYKAYDLLKSRRLLELLPGNERAELQWS